MQEEITVNGTPQAFDRIILADPVTGMGIGSVANPLYTTSSGGGSTTPPFTDVLYTDDTGAQFVFRDNGATPPVFTAYLIPAGTAYTVGANPRPYAVRDVIVTSSALPTGAALEAGNLASIATSAAKIPSLGQALAAASVPVVLTAAQLITLTPPGAITGFALEAGHLAAIDTKTPALGQALAAASLPVVLTAAQLTTLTPPAAPTNYALETGGNLASAAASVANIPAKGQTTMANSMPITVASNQSAIPVNGSAVTQPISVASLPLPAGASTATKQPALGTAGSASTDVLTIQGIASMTAIKVDGSAVTQPISGSVSVSNLPATQPVSGTVTANAGTNLNTSALALESGGNLATLAGGVSSSKYQVNITQVAGGTAITGGVTGSVATGGNVAHDGVNSGNPDYFGGEAIAHGTNPTAVSAGDRTKGYFNRAGVPFVIAGHPNAVTIEAAFTAAQTDTALVTVAGGLKIVVTEVEFICANSNTVDVVVRMGFGAANTPTTTGVVLTHPGVPAGSGVVRGNGSGILGVGADGEDLRITCGVPTSGSCRALITYFTIES